MEACCRSFAGWPEILSCLRVLCRVFRISSYRTHLAKSSIKIEGIDLAKLLKEFTAGFAKWRFETLHEVLRQLGPLRRLCEDHIERSHFGGVQDEDDMTAFMKACKTPELWRFIIYA